MPAARDRDRSKIENALATLNRALSELGAPWMVIGGIAVIAHGVQRMTTDIDVVIRGDAISVHALIKALRRHRIAPRIDGAEAFAAANLVLLTRHRPTQVDLDLSLGWTTFEHEALAARASTRFGRVAVPMARVDDLLVFKAIAGRPRDIDDVVTLLTLYPEVDMTRVRARVRALAEAAEAPELELGLEQIVATLAALRAHTPSATTSSPRRSRSKAAKAATVRVQARSTHAPTTPGTKKRKRSTR